MSSDEEWGPWKRHNGGTACPVLVGEYFQWDWINMWGRPQSFEGVMNAQTHRLFPGAIQSGLKLLRYRVRRPPSAAMERLREIAANPPKMPVTEDA